MSHARLWTTLWTTARTVGLAATVTPQQLQQGVWFDKHVCTASMGATKRPPGDPEISTGDREALTP